jgi:hypothetical protein
VDVDAGQIAVRNPQADGSEAPKSFTFDAVFDPDSTQRSVYEYAAQGIVDSVLEGYNGTIFAYGQTGTGKTHTMEGLEGTQHQGIIPNSFEHIFASITASANKQYLVRASYLEIYNEEIRDLLSKNPKEKLDLKVGCTGHAHVVSTAGLAGAARPRPPRLKPAAPGCPHNPPTRCRRHRVQEHKEGGVYVKGLNSFVVKSVPEIRNVLEVGGRCRAADACTRPAVLVGGAGAQRRGNVHAATCRVRAASRDLVMSSAATAGGGAVCVQVGKKNRSVGATLMNQDSSRSHSVFAITVECAEQGPNAVSPAALRPTRTAGRVISRGAVKACLIAGPAACTLSSRGPSLLRACAVAVEGGTGAGSNQAGAELLPPPSAEWPCACGQAQFGGSGRQ